MQDSPTQTIKAVIRTEKRLEFIIGKLTQRAVARHDISIQEEATVFDSAKSPHDHDSSLTKDYFLKDDFGWVIGLSLGFPIFICVIIAVFIIGDVRSPTDNLVYGVSGAVVGTLIGLMISKYIVKKHRQHIAAQEKKGGYVLLITVSSEKEKEEVLDVLKAYHAESIIVETGTI